MKKSAPAVRALCLALCLAFLLPCVSALGETTKVTAYLLRLRSQPSAKATVLDAYPRGTVVTILRKGSPWTKVKVRGKVGYMQTNMLAYGRTYTSESFSSGGSVMYVAKGIRLNLREAPSSDSEILASYRGGTKVTVLRKGKYWYRVSVNGKVGYMGKDYLTDTRE